MSKDPQQVVIDFCAAWDRRSVEDVLAYMSPDIVYQNVPAPAMNGKDAAAKFIVPLLKNTTKIEFKMLAVSASGDKVLTERVDLLHFATGTVTIPLMGIFVVRDGKISEWRDYADGESVRAGLAEAKIDFRKMIE